ncbi:hypothetical protein PV326_001799 [Microctonus aethiopoides]|nr:hypothetical protein PV326_001799 [Microctonus aethiopoides]
MDEDSSFVHHSASNLAIMWAAIASVGWYILAVAVALFFASPYIKEKYSNWRTKKDEEEYYAKYHKNPDLFEERLTAVEAARRKMQEKYNEQAEIAKEKEEAKKELKRQQLLKLTNNLNNGNKLGIADNGPSSSKSSTLRNDYNPLMGDTNRGYKPPKRSCCGKKCG